MVVSSSKDNKSVLILNILEEHFGDVVKVNYCGIRKFR